MTMTQKPIKAFADFAIANPTATAADMQAAFPYHSEKTIAAQMRRTGLFVSGTFACARQERAVKLGDLGEKLTIQMLEQRGWIVEHTNGLKRNVKLIDLKATDPVTGRSIEIQVKASRSSCAPLKQANVIDDLWYVIVDCRSDVDNPRFYVLSGRDMIEPIYYRSPCGIAGRIRQRQLMAYENRWDLL